MGSPTQRQSENGIRAATDLVTCSSSSGRLNIVELKLANGRGIGAGQNVEANAAGRHRGEDIGLLMTNGVRGGNGLPGTASPHIDGIFLNVLAVVQPLHCQRAIERDGLVEPDLDHRAVRTCGCGPERVRIAIQRCSNIGRSRSMCEGEIMSVALAQRLAKFLETSDVALR